jgi:hypothetical protein
VIYTILFWAVQVVAAGLTVVALRRSTVGRRGLLLVLTALPLSLCIFWGAWFGVEPGAQGAADGSFVAEAPALFALAGIIIAVGVVGFLRNARLIAAAVGLLEVASTLMVALLATMQVTGSWL